MEHSKGAILMKRQTLLWAILALAVLAGACDEGTKNTNPDPDGFQDGTNLDTIDIERSYLEVINPPNGEALKLFFQSDSNLEVGFFGPDALPIPNVSLAFEILSSTDNCAATPSPCVKLNSLTGQTGPDGVVLMKVSSFSKAADISIQVSVEGNDAVAPEMILVQIRPKDSYDLKVEFTYSGARQFTVVKPMLFETQQTCADVFTPPMRDPRNLPTAARQNPDTPRNADGTITASTFIALPTGKSYVAVGYAETAAGLVTVYGCNDERPTVGDGLGHTVTVQLVEVPITVKGTYKLTSNFNLLSGLPRRAVATDSMEAGDWVDMIVMLFQNPGQMLYTLLGPYIEDIGGISIPAGLEPVIVAMINDGITAAAPDWLNNILTVGDDITELVTSLQLVGEFVINEEPNAETGVLAAGQVHRYTGVSFVWRLPCIKEGNTPAACSNARTGLSFVELGKPNLAIEGTFSGAVTKCANSNDQCIVIDQHGMTVPYGEILLAIIEGWALPALFNDPLIDSLDQLIQRVLLQYIVDWYDPTGTLITTTGCEAVGDVLADVAGDSFVSSVAKSIGEYACNEGISYLTNLIYDQAAKLTIDTEDNLVLSTLGDCKIKDADGNLEYDMMGDPLTEESRCTWDIKFRFSATSDPVDMTGKFHAAR
ncbi:MAG: hypothetical protein CO108_08455 [Deltaproteobacteria bacterium CG_4_9_14_3_um_filter_63_12]|nr:MAG: hypothetical protein CO108_08455 [Deltaproteobacteria bacterium CG_4_9_14_3_um_filter_63_12]